MKIINKRFYFGVTLLILLLIVSFKSEDNSFELHKNMMVTEPIEVTVANEKESSDYSGLLPYTGKSYVGFKEALAYRESRGNYFIVNDYGYLGKYQFGKSALKFYGVENSNTFLNSPELQERIFKMSLQRAKWIFYDEIKLYDGKTIGGVLITESGILAASHLAGVSNVKRFFKKKGKYQYQDAFGTSIRNYMRNFANYDLSSIKAKEAPKVYHICYN